MGFTDVLLGIGQFTFVALVLSLVGVLGVDRLVAVSRDSLLDRLRTVVPYVLFLGGILALTATVRANATDLSWTLNIRLAPVIYNVEGEFVAWVQSFQTPLATEYFSVVYIYGYVYLLVFPFLAYLLADDLTPFRVLILAYALNYVAGVLLYILFVAYGPRNYLIGESLLYNNWPEAQLLTTRVNRNVNVFPSLHAALSTTIALLSIRTRDIYPRWPLIAVPLAVSVSVATMYLAIHWATDVVGGVVLAVVSVWLAERFHDPFAERVDGVWRRLLAFLRQARQSDRID